MSFPPRAALHAVFTLSLAFLGAPKQAPQSLPQAHPAPQEVRIVILHTNDLHGQFLPRDARGRAGEKIGGLAAIDAVVARERAAAKESGAHVLLVDSGDWYQGTPEGNHPKDGAPGALVIDWMNRARYDAVAIGNHEFDFGLPNVKALLARAKVPIVSANLHLPGSPTKTLAKPFAVHERGGVRIAFVGLLTDDTPRITPKGALGEYVLANELEAGRRWFDEARKVADLVFFIGHDGVESDRKLARRVPECPVIFGGHSHTKIDPPEVIEHEASALSSSPWKRELPARTYVMQTGAKAENLDRVELRIDPADKKIRAIDARLKTLEIKDVGEDETTKRWIESETAAVSKAMDEVIATATAPPEAAARGQRTDPAPNFVTDALLSEAKTLDASVVAAFGNRGGVRSKIETGPFTKRMAYELVPFDNSLVLLTLSGRDFQTLLAQSFGDDGSSRLFCAGVAGIARRQADLTWDWSDVRVDGKPIDPDGKYRVAAVSFIADGKGGFAAFTRGADRLDSGRVIRDVLTEFAVKKKSFALDDRLRLRGEMATISSRPASRPTANAVGSTGR